MPLVPYYRVESELTVLSYLMKNMSNPVPRVIPFGSSAAIDLGFEWILLGRIEVVTLYDVWRKAPWDQNSRLSPRSQRS